MTAPLELAHIRAIVLDIEGTVTPVEFVYEVLFPYARAHVKEFLRQHQGDEEVRADIWRLREQHAGDSWQGLDPPAWQESSRESAVGSVAAYTLWLMDRDRKSTPLKSLQGRIWQAGYRSGELRSEVFPDVPPAFGRWRQERKVICIFSSGSVLAQKLLFANTTAGDLTPYVREYFDTTVGAKTDAESYRHIALALAFEASEIVFVSDSIAELDAARLAGMRTALCVRSERGEKATGTHPVITTFDQLSL